MKSPTTPDLAPATGVPPLAAGSVLALVEVNAPEQLVEQEADYLLCIEPQGGGYTYPCRWHVGFWDAADRTFRCRADSRIALANVVKVYALPDAEEHFDSRNAGDVPRAGNGPKPKE